MSISLVIYPVENLEGAKTFFTMLMGGEPYADSPYYVGYRSGDVEIGLDPHGHKYGGPVPYWNVADIKAEIERLTAAGAQVVQDVRDVGGGLLVAIVKSESGSVAGLRQFPAA